MSDSPPANPKKGETIKGPDDKDYEVCCVDKCSLDDDDPSQWCKVDGDCEGCGKSCKCYPFRAKKSDKEPKWEYFKEPRTGQDNKKYWYACFCLKPK